MVSEKRNDHAKVKTFYKSYFKPKNSLRTKKIYTLEPLGQEQLTIAQDWHKLGLDFP